jgi:ABC-type branched-subunit amino acid transport system substrate-binding protein
VLVNAIRAAGLNRAAIRDALAATTLHPGALGPTTFDGTGAATTPPTLAIVRNGSLHRINQPPHRPP